MASKGRSKASRKDCMVFKVEQMEWRSKEYYIHGTSFPEKMRCHGCGCVSNTMYPLENECEGHGLCRDCKETDFARRHHRGNVTAEALRYAVGQTNKAAKKLTIRCPFCESKEGFLDFQDHMHNKHPELLAIMLKSSQTTAYEQEKPASTQEKHRTSFFTWREDNFSQNADVTVESEDDEAPACKHCNEESDARDLGEHEKACPKEGVQCRDCDEWIKQEELSDHKLQNVVDTIQDLQQKIKEMERCNMSQQEEARNEKAKLEKRIQELENRQLEADQYHIDLEDDVKVHRTALQNLEDKVGRISKEGVTQRRVEMLNERVETYLGPLERLLNGLRNVDKE